MSGITGKQHEVLMSPLRGNRVAHRPQGGKQLSYLEAWEVKAHLIRVFGFGHFDVRVHDDYHVANREYMTKPDEQKNIPAKPMIEVIWKASVTLTLRDPDGDHLAIYTESAVGSASGPPNMLGEHHDNAVKTAASDALKRCAINLGTQFGLSLYDNGNLNDVVRMTLVSPAAAAQPKQPDAEQASQLADSVGAVRDRTTALGEMWVLLDKAGLKDNREDRLAYYQSIVNRPVASTNDLIYPEVELIVAALRTLTESEQVSA